MKKILQLLKKPFTILEDLKKTEPLTWFFILLEAASLFVLALSDGLLWNMIDNYFIIELLQMAALTNLMMIMVSAIVTRLKKRDSKAAVPVLVLGAVTAILFAGLMIFVGDKGFFDSLAHAIGRNRTDIIMAGYVISLVLMFLYSKFPTPVRSLTGDGLEDHARAAEADDSEDSDCHSEADELEAPAPISLPEYAKRVFVRLTRVSLVYGVLNLGCIFLLLVFTELLFGDFGDLFEPVAMQLLGLFYIPSVYDALDGTEDDIGKFFETLIRFVLFGLVAAAFVIIYLYIGKILILRKFPKNTVFIILALLFWIGMPISYMCMSFEEDRLAKKAPLTFLPLLVLQAYTIFIRVQQYGITESRYAGLMLIGIELAAIVLCVTGRERIRYLFPLAAACAVLATMVPWVNMIDVSDWSQSRRPESEATEAVREYRDALDFYYSPKVNPDIIDISDYDRMLAVSHYFGSGEFDITKVSVYSISEELDLYADFTPVFEEILGYYETEQKDSDRDGSFTYIRETLKTRKLPITELTTLYLTDFNMDAERKTDSDDDWTVTWLGFDGYLLLKDGEKVPVSAESQPLSDAKLPLKLLEMTE